MLRLFNTRLWCVAATVLAVNTHFDPLTAAADRGRQSAIDPQVATEAFVRARAWVSEFAAPRMEAPESQLALGDASGVCVVLRRHGKVLGTGIDDVGDDLMLRRAVGRALNETLSDPALQAVASAIRRDAGAGEVGTAGSRPDDRPEQEAEARLETLRRDVGHSLTLELEISGPRTPLVGATIATLASKIEPGIDGVSLLRQRKWFHAYPASLRTANLGGEPLKTLTSLAINAGIPMADLDDAAAAGDASFYTFRTVDLVQSSPSGEPVEVIRGERLVPPEAVARGRIESLANGLAQHLLRRRFPDPPEGSERLPLGFMGDYNPVSDQFAPTVAPPLDQALGALALTRFAQTAGTAAPLAREGAAAARQILRDLAAQAPREESPTDDLLACAVMVMIACETPSCLGDEQIAAMIRQSYAKLLQFAAQGSEQDQSPAAAMLHAVAGCAVTRAMGAKVPELQPASPEVVRRILDQAWAGSSEEQCVGLLPWIGWAERDFALASGASLAHTQEFARIIAALDRARVGAGDGAVPDLIGGLNLTGANAHGAPGSRPTSQTARPATWMASVHANSDLIPPEQRGLAWTRHLESMRFLCQLTVSDTRASTFRNPARSLGGACVAPWDSRQPLAAQAMFLLAAIETLKNWPESPN